MFFYEIHDPYYALIKANNDEEAVRKYIEVVAGDDSEFESLVEECEPVPRDYAFERFSAAPSEDGRHSQKAENLKYFNSNEIEILLIDRSLL